MRRELDFVAPLFVPGHRPGWFRKAAASAADALIIDLEDAVPPEAKQAARAALTTDFTESAALLRMELVGASSKKMRA